MFKPILIAICCAAALPLVHSTSAIAQSRTAPNTRSADTVGRSQTMQRSPESIERARERAKIRQRQTRRRQLEWRRRYGDLAPSRQQPPLN